MGDFNECFSVDRSETMDTLNDNNLSARSKILKNWSNSWESITLNPPIMPIEDISDKKSKKKTLISVQKRSETPPLIKPIVKSVVNIWAEFETSEEVVVKPPVVESPDVPSVCPSIEPTGAELEPDPIDDKCDKNGRKRKPKTTSKETTDKKKRVIKKPKTTKSSIVQKVTNPFQSSFHQFLNNKTGDPLKQLSEETSDKTNSVINCIRNKQKSETQKMVKKRVNKLRTNNKMNNILVKRNRKRPLIVKNLMETKSFLNFCTQKFPAIKEGVPFIQDRSCRELSNDFELSELNYCLDCKDPKGNPKSCRFFQYRTLVKNGDKLSLYAFAEEGDTTQSDTKIWLPVAAPKDLDQLTAMYLMIFVGPQLCQIYRDEKKITDEYMCATWRRQVKGTRELCDKCETTIFNTHYVCQKCGIFICVDCFAKRQTQSLCQTSHSTRHRTVDEFGWILCNEKKTHDLNDFLVAVFMTKSVFGSVVKTYHKIRNQLQIKGICACDELLPQLKFDIRQSCVDCDLTYIYPHVGRQWLCDKKLLVLTDPKCDDNLKLFQINWLKGYPVIIENVVASLRRDIWLPTYFNFLFGREMSRLVNCMDGSIIPKRQMCLFWDGFEDVDKRLIDEETGEEMILKLKDWPPNAEFREKLPLFFDDLMNALPLREYTRYDGNRNLASRLPEFYLRPDLGPKMYCAYGSVLHPEKGTTNLHLDMSDAVNVMIYVGVAQKDNKPLELHIKEANNLLIKGGCDQQMLQRADQSNKSLGALWHIWKAEDADKIRLFLNKVAKENNQRIESNNDPIHDQSWYLDENLRTRLENEYNVKALAVVQCLGDAILVPAGAPHQVQNIHSCIKVAGEFVSPENVANCLTMTQEFRKLSKRHSNHEDKLQIKNIIYHSIKDAMSVLLPPRANNFPLPAPPKLVSRSPSPPFQKESSLLGKALTLPVVEEQNEESFETKRIININLKEGDCKPCVTQVSDLEVSAPEVSAPEVSAPEVSAPEVSAPEVSALEVSALEVSAPEVSAPEMSAPEVSDPESTSIEDSEPEEFAEQNRMEDSMPSLSVSDNTYNKYDSDSKSELNVDIPMENCAEEQQLSVIIESLDEVKATMLSPPPALCPVASPSFSDTSDKVANILSEPPLLQPFEDTY